MTNFLDGPAKGQVLKLRRCPYFLRVVVKTAADGKQEWDALDQPGDSPDRDERLYAYRCKELRGWIHLNTGRRPGGGFFAIADYELIDPQPSDDVMRLLWAQWCEMPERRAEYEKAAAQYTPPFETTP